MEAVNNIQVTGSVPGDRVQDPTADHRRRVVRRRTVFAVLTGVTILSLVIWMARILGADGWSVIDVVMLLFFAHNTPWVAIGLWNSIIGFGVLRLTRDPMKAVAPIARNVGPGTPLRSRTAVVMPVYNEDPDRIFRHLRIVADTLEATGEADKFDLFLLSDTNRPDVAEEEERRFASWQALFAGRSRLQYRRRSENTGRKVGNIRDFCDRWGDDYDHMVVLDADSVMTGEAIIRLTRLMEANPTAGIIQSLPVGLPSVSAFARVFQFGMRHGMRVYAAGQAWWQGDEGPYWGHNAIIRLDAFRRHCTLPRLPGKAPFGGDIISHDQVEAALMRRAGYACWVVPEEGGSYEENPPTYPDFLKRDLRWCQGNMQYLGLFALKGFSLRPMGWVQLTLAIMMYLAIPAWLGFVLFGFTQGALMAMGMDDALIVGPFTGVSAIEAVALFGVMISLGYAPKFIGMIDTLTRRRVRLAYGGTAAIVAGAVTEFVFSVLLAPVVSVAIAIFMVGLMFGRKVQWDEQMRDSHSVPVGLALRSLWPQVLVGVLFAGGLILTVPGALPWAAPFFGALLVAVPFVVITANPALGRFFVRLGLCAIPEERLVPAGLEPATRRVRSLTGTLDVDGLPVPSLAQAVSARAAE